MNETGKTGIIDPEKVTGVSDEKKEYYSIHGYVPYQINGGRVKWAQRSHAIREVQGHLYRQSRTNPMCEIRSNYRRARQMNSAVASFFIALWRYIEESR